ncbi:MAG: HAD family hydrolase [Clostridiales bacterium]|nr:HAD family hydrolase [Clostridiales bacterium]
MLKLCIFDLDGTTADTIEDLSHAADYALRKKGLPTHTLDEYKYFVGNGIPKLISRAAKTEDKAVLQELLRDFKDYYAKHLTDKTKPYSGIDEMFKTLTNKGVQLAVYSNKADEYVGIILKKLFSDVSFLWYAGNREGYSPKPDVELMERYLKRYNIKPEECLFIGDSNVDIQTAKNAKMRSCGVLWGFRTREELENEGADFIAAEPEDIVKIADRL